MRDRAPFTVIPGDALPGVSEPLFKSIPPNTRSPDANLYRKAFRYAGRKPWNVIREYIAHYTLSEGALVVDPFAGGGVTLGESLRLNRRVFAMDIQPVPELINRSILAPLRPSALRAQVEMLSRAIRPTLAQVGRSEAKAAAVLASFDTEFLDAPPPQSVRRKGIASYWDTIEPAHAAGLLVTREAIQHISDENARTVLWLAFANMLVFASRNYHGKKNRKKGTIEPWRGDNILNAYGRMGGFEHATYIPIDEIFDRCMARVVELKEITEADFGHLLREPGWASFRRGDAAGLAEHLDAEFPNESVDYLITDPPYGSLVRYDHLLAYWNAWLPTGPVAVSDPLESSVRGRDKSVFTHRLTAILRQSGEVLKLGGWMSLFYLDTSDFRLWHEIVESAAEARLELVNSVWAEQSIASRTQNQNPMSGTRGAVVANFRRVRAPLPVAAPASPVEPAPTLYNYLRLELQRLVVENLGATTSEILAHLSDEIYTRASLRALNITGTRSVPKLLQELGASDLRELRGFHGGEAQLWTLDDEAPLDPVLDAYDRLRFVLFKHLVQNGPTPPSELQRLVFTGQNDVRPEEVPHAVLSSILSTFASRRGGARAPWEIDWKRRHEEVQLRLDLFRSSAKNVRHALDRRFAGEDSALRISGDGFAAVAAASPGGVDSIGWKQISQALLVLVRTLRDEFGSVIAEVSAVHETARGEWSAEDPRQAELPLLVVLSDDADPLVDWDAILLDGVFAPLYERTHLDLVPYVYRAGARDIDVLFGSHSTRTPLLQRVDAAGQEHGAAHSRRRWA
jgi:hypothetical protein